MTYMSADEGSKTKWLVYQAQCPGKPLLISTTTVVFERRHPRPRAGWPKAKGHRSTSHHLVWRWYVTFRCQLRHGRIRRMSQKDPQSVVVSLSAHSMSGSKVGWDCRRWPMMQARTSRVWLGISEPRASYCVKLSTVAVWKCIPSCHGKVAKAILLPIGGCCKYISIGAYILYCTIHSLFISLSSRGA